MELHRIVNINIFLQIKTEKLRIFLKYNSIFTKNILNLDIFPKNPYDIFRR